MTTGDSVEAGVASSRLRTAILGTAVACMAYVVFWIRTTQFRDVREVVPFGEDPYDLVASVAIVLLPLVGGLTAIRVVRYGASRIPAGPVARRILLGLGICLALVSAALFAAGAALVAAPMEMADGIGVGGVVLAGIAITGATTVVAWVALTGAAVASRDLAATGAMTEEPDALDDLVAVLPLQGTLRTRIGEVAERFRRHRILAGLGAALVAGVTAVIWHGMREGAWASPAAALIYGGILVAILLLAYGLLIGPLRVLRAA